jgi:hypothetical protein
MWQVYEESVKRMADFESEMTRAEDSQANWKPNLKLLLV